MDASVAFYTDILGLKQGWHPETDRPRVWLYAGDQPILHLEEDLEGDPAARNQFRHIAVQTRGYETTRDRLDRAGLDFSENIVGATGVRQIFLDDPNGIAWELNFASGSA